MLEDSRPILRGALRNTLYPWHPPLRVDPISAYIPNRGEEHAPNVLGKMKRTYAEGQNEDKVIQPYQAGPCSKQPNLHGEKQPPGKVKNYLIMRHHRNRRGASGACV